MIHFASFNLIFHRLVFELIGSRCKKKKNRRNSAVAETSYANQHVKTNPGMLNDGLLAAVFNSFFLLSGTSGKRKKSPKKLPVLLSK